MKVRLNTIMAGPPGTVQPGQIVDLDAETAHSLVAGGYAQELAAAAPPTGTAITETASLLPPETADVKTSRGRRR